MGEFNLFPAMTIAFSVTAAFLFALRPVARSIGLVDRPGGRKSHQGDVPITGGICMFIGVFSGLSVVENVQLHVPSLFVASLVLVSIGALDDKYLLPPSVRVAAQAGSILIMVFGADLILAGIGNPFGLGEISLGPLALLATLVVSLTVINAYNLIDGVDGLSGSLALIALLALSVINGLEAGSTTVALTIAAAVTGFLLYNFPVVWNRHVRTFMGDAGSTFLGFVIVWTSLAVSQGENRAISPVYILWFASIPIYDLLTCVVRRSMAGKSPFTPGRDHFHHTLKRGGMGVRQVLGIMTGLQLVYALFAIVAHALGVPEPAMFVAWVGLLASQRFIFTRLARHNRLRKLKDRLAMTRQIS